jgi:hypothetical protein
LPLTLNCFHLLAAAAFPINHVHVCVIRGTGTRIYMYRANIYLPGILYRAYVYVLPVRATVVTSLLLNGHVYVYPYL